MNKENEFLMSLLKEYLSLLEISQTSFANEIGVSHSSISVWLDCRQGMSKVSNNKILSYFKLDTISKLEEYLINEIKILKQRQVYKEKTITLLEEYLKLSKVSKKAFADETKISYDDIINLFKYEQSIKEENYEKILNYFNLNEEELILYLETKIKSLKDNSNSEIKYFSVTKDLKEYLYLMNISKVTFAKEINIDIFTTSNFLNGRQSVTEEEFKRILEYFKVNSYYELEDYIQTNLKLLRDQKKPNLEYIHQLSLLKEYLLLSNMSQRIFAIKVNSTSNSINRWLNGKQEMTKGNYEKILNYFNLNSMEELTEYLSEEIEKINKRDNTKNLSLTKETKK